MLATHQLKIIEDRHNRPYQPHRKGGSTSSEGIISNLEAFAIPAYYPKGTVLFVEGQPTRGVFILHSSRVKLFTSSAGGKNFILGFANPGEILGLAGTVSGAPYEAWAEATELTQTGFIQRKHFVNILRCYGEIAMQVAIQLGNSYRSAIAGARMMVLSRSASQKLAKFLLDWCESNRPFQDAQVIGTSRETVTRLLSGFKKRGLIQWKGCNLVLTDKAGLLNSAVD
jgi:CRP/FNR family transcriptional regulator, cyclic AMP receptor protein